jgi:hypothetical protein
VFPKKQTWQKNKSAGWKRECARPAIIFPDEPSSSVLQRLFVPRSTFHDFPSIPEKSGFRHPK